MEPSSLPPAVATGEDTPRTLNFDPLEALDGYPTPKPNAITSRDQTKVNVYDLLWIAD